AGPLPAESVESGNRRPHEGEHQQQRRQQLQQEEQRQRWLPPAGRLSRFTRHTWPKGELGEGEDLRQPVAHVQRDDGDDRETGADTSGEEPAHATITPARSSRSSTSGSARMPAESRTKGTDRRVAVAARSA